MPRKKTQWKKFSPRRMLRDSDEQVPAFLICVEKLPIHKYNRNQEYWARKWARRLLHRYKASQLSSSLKAQRDVPTAKAIKFVEASVAKPDETARNSMSMNRAPVPPSETTRGNALNYPFWPGGFPDPVSKLPSSGELTTSGLLTVPLGFKRGLHFKSDGFTLRTESDSTIVFPINTHYPTTQSVIDILDLVKQEQSCLDMWQPQEKTNIVAIEDLGEPASHVEKDVMANEIPVLKISEPTQFITRETEWAVMLDSTKPVTDFHEQVPELAHEFKFELDTFQKQAIIQLEKHNHVFVAAHTSAGKTVVAEYAIALSQNHMTRTIYTSPIKALSNQKYRDFKMTFKDVGLITGDFQINPTASCLIMTTEILRTMLYCGSDVTRDLEYVIFDEVHYINDKERGHVWEQVLILLPPHVCVVLLSATVPNTMEFADWLGRTYQKKVYVVSTSQRPVPLQHYLYTGAGGSTKNNRYLVMNSNGWIQKGYKSASESLPQESRAPKKTAPQERTMWYALVDHLKRNELLPVVVFTFSRAQCDTNANNLRSLDLTTQKEKSQVYIFFEECIKNLKEPDQQIPQIIRMRELLNRGIGVHHSGVLPIIKEMVEMLFQKGLVKLLFATETFSMGINMPARTVVFNSIRKHDGHEFRNLHPAEYIQMAGRAGRRGLDKQGTVIILCKQKMPSSMELRDMMTGKPSHLTSQFRLTYGMVLSLLRVESLSVEDMMSRSFREADHQRKMIDVREKLKKVEAALKHECKELSEYLQPLIKFYDRATMYLHVRKMLLPNIITSYRVNKELTPGKILLVTHAAHINKLAMLLSTSTKMNKTLYKVLVLTDNTTDNNSMIKINKNSWYKMLALATSNHIFSPIGAAKHEVLTIKPLDIFEITNKSFKIEADLVISDWEKRQLPRFQEEPPGSSCNTAILELMKLTRSCTNRADSENRIQYLDFIHDLNINDQNLHMNVLELSNLKEELIDNIGRVQIPNFEEQFLSVYKKKSLEEERDELKFWLSNESMFLYPDYEKRLHLLRELKYVDGHNRVELKGRVACEMGMNELMITELVLRNVLTKLDPAEVAALLSCLVFQAQTKKEPKLQITKELTMGIREIKSIHKEISDLETKYKISHDIGKDEDLNFGLVRVVYNWASDTPFAEIMEMTDVQEGIIVRCIQQLNETICDVRNAARLIGDPELQSKMEEASTAIKRDIVFAASLYTQREGTPI